MAFWNKNWATLSGTYTGTVDKNFKVKITGIGTTTLSYKWAVKNSDSNTWSSWTNVSSVAINTASSMQDGLSVLFTRDAVSKYQINDLWIWNVFSNLQLSSNTGNYKRLIKIEDGDKDSLVALNTASGEVALIKDYETDAPSVVVNKTIPASSEYDYVINNKLAYIATGPTNPAHILGFNKTNNLGDPEPVTEFIAEQSYETLNVIGTDSAVFDESVVLRGDAATYDDPDLLVGIDYNSTLLNCWNKDTMVVSSITLTTQPIQIRENPNQHSSGRTNGIAVLCEPEIQGTINCMHFYTMGDEGNIFTRDKTIHFNSPDDNPKIKYDSDVTGGNWVDFLIVSTKADVTDSGEDYHLVLSTGGPKESISNHQFGMGWSGNSHYYDGYMFKYEDIDECTDGQTITGSQYVNITPKHDQTNASTSEYGDDNETFRFGSYNQFNGTFNGNTFEGGEYRCHFIQKTNLALLGYDYNGENPIIAITVKFEPIKMYIDYVQDQGGSGETTPYPNLYNLMYDGSQFWYWIWATWLVPLSVTGSKSHPIMPHYRDWGQDDADLTVHQGTFERPNVGDGARALFDETNGNAKYEFTSALSNAGPIKKYTTGSGTNQPIPSTYPLTGRGAGYLDGRKWGGFGSSASHSATSNGNAIGKGQRVAIYYMRNRAVDGLAKGTLRVIKAWHDVRPYNFYGSGSNTSTSNIFLFPVPYATLSTLFSNYSTALSEGAYGTSKQMSFPQMNKPVIPSSRYLVDVSTGTDWAEIADDSEFIQVTSKNDEQNYYKSVGIEHTYNTEEGNDIGANVPWLSITPSAMTDDWVGPDNIEKSYYKCSLLYDGFQESALLPVVNTRTETGDIATATKIVIKIDESKVLSKRISAVVLYRADDEDDASTSPRGLYRFVAEKKLSSFSLTGGFWETSVTDDGTVGASYEALNGISETLVGLGVDYGINCALNGYMFVGKPYHGEFDDSDHLIFRSQPGKYSIFDWSKDFIQLTFRPTALAGFMGKLFVFGKSQLAIINPETLIIEDEIEGIGCVGPKTIYTTSTGLYWFDLLNIYNASPKITKIGTNIQTVDTYGWSNLESSVKENAVAGYDGVKQSFQIYFKTGNDKRCWNFYEPTTRWDLWETPYEVYDSITGEDGKPILLCEDGRLVKYTASTDRRNWEWESKKMTMGDNTNYKKVRVIKADSDAMNRSNVTLQYKTDINTDYQNGSDVSDSYQKTGSSWKGTAKKVDTADSKLRWIKVKLAGANSGTSDTRTHNIGIVYKPKKPK